MQCEEGCRLVEELGSAAVDAVHHRIRSDKAFGGGRAIVHSGRRNRVCLVRCGRGGAVRHDEREQEMDKNEKEKEEKWRGESAKINNKSCVWMYVCVSSSERYTGRCAEGEPTHTPQKEETKQPPPCTVLFGSRLVIPSS